MHRVQLQQAALLYSVGVQTAPQYQTGQAGLDAEHKSWWLRCPRLPRNSQRERRESSLGF